MWKTRNYRPRWERKLDGEIVWLGTYVALKLYWSAMILITSFKDLFSVRYSSVKMVRYASQSWRVGGLLGGGRTWTPSWSRSAFKSLSAWRSVICGESSADIDAKGMVHIPESSCSGKAMKIQRLNDPTKTQNRYFKRETSWSEKRGAFVVKIEAVNSGQSDWLTTKGPCML